MPLNESNTSWSLYETGKPWAVAGGDGTGSILTTGDLVGYTGTATINISSIASSWAGASPSAQPELLVKAEVNSNLFIQLRGRLAGNNTQVRYFYSDATDSGWLDPTADICISSLSAAEYGVTTYVTENATVFPSNGIRRRLIRYPSPNSAKTLSSASWQHNNQDVGGGSAPRRLSVQQVLAPALAGLNAPTLGAVTAITDTGFTVAVTDNSTVETGFVFQVSTQGVGGPFVNLTPNGAANITSYTGAGLSGSTIYHLRALATDGTNFSVASNVVGPFTTAISSGGGGGTLDVSAAANAVPSFTSPNLSLIHI